jgi:membrane-associated protein
MTILVYRSDDSVSIMLSPENLLSLFGNMSIYAVAAIIFMETGLLLGFFLPGDSLLFATGMMIASGVITTPLWLSLLLIFVAAVLGNQVGYMIGNKAGHSIFNKPNSKLFSHKNVEKTHTFFEKHGGKSILLARFVPVIRTFIPVAAGVGEMNKKVFLIYSVIGAAIWGVGVTLLGTALGNIPFVNKNLELILVLIVAISFIPVALEYLKARKHKNA